MTKSVISARMCMVVFCLAGLLCSCQKNESPRNLLLITLDTTRADRLGCYGYDKPLTPNLDALAREGVVFDMAIAQAAVTPVSHASILTGLDPYHHGLRVLHGHVANRLNDRHETLAEVWQKAGGQTAAFISAYPVSEAFGLHQGFDLFDDAFQSIDPAVESDEKGTVNTDNEQRRADATTEAAIQWLDTEYDAQKPMFMWVHYFDPHDPRLLPPQELVDEFVTETEDRTQMLLQAYDCEVFYMDAQIGRLFESFKKRGLWEDTIIAVVGDHGEGLGQHDWWSHGILYQEQIRVPFILRAPRLKQAPKVKSLVRTVDLMPTLLELTGIDRSLWKKMDGLSLKNAMRTGKTREDLIAYSDSVNILSYGRQDDPSQFDKKHDKLYCVMQSGYKLIYHQLKPEQTEFYNLYVDPFELNNLAATKPPVMRVFIEHLDSLKALSVIVPGMTPTDLERLQKLKDLGYGY